MSIQFGATCFFNTPDEFSLVVKVAQKFPFVKYVEFRGERPFVFPDITPMDKLSYYKDILIQAGLSNTLHTTMYDINMATLNPWLKDANIACYKKYIDIAEYLESEVIVVHGGQLFYEFVNSPLKQDFMELAEKHLCDSLTELAEYGQKKGVKVALENSPPSKKGIRIVFNPENHLRIIKRINHPNLGALLDFAHAYLFRLDLLDYLQKIKPYLLEIHAHNNFGEEDEHWGLTKGNIDYQSILQQDEVQDIPFIMEIESYNEVLFTLEWLTKLGFSNQSRIIDS
ncbi:MAG: TIM barrel protein [Aliifodinibius sp.]|nr:sugar phosphate isomerase/epimerase [Fodinibius sp.]NIV10652.1 TIM barrel protein [Fodinibius sp.]NIY24268.1 TIM barrel protein [Fodinibius sp.]